MKILVQQNSDRDCVGITNGLHGHEVYLWNDEDLIEADLYIFTRSEGLGFKAANLADNKRCIFFKCKKPATFKNTHLSIESIPPCADIVRYPLSFPSKELRCNALYLSNFANRTFELSHIQSPFRIVGTTPVNLPNYIGRLSNPQDVSRYCLSADVCIDFELESAIDLAKIGCKVITSQENTLGIPTFTLSNINDVISRVAGQKRPVLNPYENKIMTYKNLVDQILGANNAR